MKWFSYAFIAIVGWLLYKRWQEANSKKLFTADSIASDLSIEEKEQFTGVANVYAIEAESRGDALRSIVEGLEKTKKQFEDKPFERVVSKDDDSTIAHFADRLLSSGEYVLTSDGMVVSKAEPSPSSSFLPVEVNLKTENFISRLINNAKQKKS
jgi:hypothetical protein